MRKFTFIVIVLVYLPILSIGQSLLTLGITGYDAKCNGSVNGSAKATPAGGVAPYSYTWAPVAATGDSISGLAAGIYSVTVTDSAGNTISASVTISQPPALIVSLDSIVLMPCFRTAGEICGQCDNVLWAVVSGGTPPYSYLWSPVDSTGDTLTGVCYKEYTVTVTDHNNCVTADSINVTEPSFGISVTSGVGQVSGAGAINAYPNPAYDMLNITVGPSAGYTRSLAVYNMLGEKVLEQAQNGNNSQHITLDVSWLAEGNYFLRITNDEGQKPVHFVIAR